MVTKERMAGASNQPAALPSISDKRMQLFNALKPYTSQLLRAREAPARLQSLLVSLQNVIRGADLDGLNSRGIFDYILFPLMPGVDSVVLMRRPGDKVASSKLPYPAAQSDAVAEAILECCVLLMQRCPVQSGEQLSDLLEHFVTVVNLGKASATEEVRLKAIQCISAMLPSKPPSSSSPSLALRGPSRAPVLGFSFSALLKAAEEEVQAGLTGSKALTAAALGATKHLVQGVDSGDALAFVLPGLASGLSKILIAAGSTSRRPSGSRVGSRAAVEALQALVSLVTVTLGDAHAQQLAEGKQAAADLSAVQALDALQKLAVPRPQQPQASAAGDNAGAQQRPASGSSMRCNRSKDWIHHTTFRLTGLIGQALPPLAAHPRTAVRAALAQGVTALLEHCSPVLTDATELLYEVLFTLAQDDWPQVSAHCQAWLASWMPRHCQAGPAGHAVPAIVERLLLGLVPALRSGEEAATLHARRLTTALQACSQQQLTSLLLNSPVSTASWAPTLCRCFAFEHSTGALLMYNTSQAGPHACLGGPLLATSTPPKHPNNKRPGKSQHTALDTETYRPNLLVTPGKPASALQSETTASEQATAREGGIAGTPTPNPTPTPAAQQASATARASDDSNSTELATIVLPRMPLGLKHITMPTAYTAMANVARALGRCSVAAGCERPSHSGRAVLHGITQALLQIFEAQVPAEAAESQSPAQHMSTSDPDMPARAGWQGKAASAVVALAEVVFGASASWHGTQQQQQGNPDFSSQHSQHDSATTATQAATTSADPMTTHARSDGWESLHSPPRSHLADAAVPTDSAVLEPIVVQALDDFSNAGVWSLATHVDPDATLPGNSPLTPQVLGENAVLIRAMLEAVGVFAQVLGRRLASSGVILRKVLLVLLERLADLCPSVATSAAAALGAVCLHCGYASRQVLLADNADYLVDGLCRQLRSLDSYPRAPYLFAAVLQQAGAGQELLPLLADPARAAFQGLSITARHSRAFHIYPFLQVLMHIVTICEAEAAALLAATQSAADQIKEALAATQPQAEDSNGGEEFESFAQASRIDAVRAFFEEHHRRKAHAATDDPPAANIAFHQDSSILEEVSSRRRQIHSVAVLAHASAEVATPLLLSATLKVGLLALKVGLGGLRALHSTTAALDLYEQVIIPATSKQEGVQPPPPDTPQMLPSIHILWGALVGALRDHRPALVQGALHCLVGICQLAGAQFMTRRVQTEAWPVLLHLMRHGMPQQSKPAYPPEGSRAAPAALQQMRHRVLHCIGQLAGTGTCHSVWRGMTGKVAEAIAVYLDSTQTNGVREATAQAILCVSTEDPDAVWLALHLAGGLHQLHSKPNPDAATFPDASGLLQMHSRLSPSGDVMTGKLSVNTLLQKVENIQANWHSQCSEEL